MKHQCSNIKRGKCLCLYKDTWQNKLSHMLLTNTIETIKPPTLKALTYAIANLNSGLSV
jgi:hypothetical protein